MKSVLTLLLCLGLASQSHYSKNKRRVVKTKLSLDSFEVQNYTQQ